MDPASKDARRETSKDVRRRKKSADSVPGSFGKFALFSEVLLTGVYVMVLSLAVVTALPAVTAGVGHLRRHLRGERDGVAELWEDFKAACSGVWVVAVGSIVAFCLVGLNLWAVSTEALPGGAVVGVVSAGLGVTLSVGLLRAASVWTPGDRWFSLVRRGVREIGADPAGSAMLFAAVVMCVVLVWMLKPLVMIVGGLVAFAVVGVEFRTARPARGER
ncbi:hypothetical protein [Sanguibacter gelidistatuariae]|nr:hypothetical protein [Sanguibacter gelidistatuariae]